MTQNDCSVLEKVLQDVEAQGVLHPAKRGMKTALMLFLLKNWYLKEGNERKGSRERLAEFTGTGLER